MSKQLKFARAGDRLGTGPTWWWVCIACLFVYLPSILLDGTWSPARPRVVPAG